LSTRATGRRRAAGRPKTPLTVITETITNNAGTLGRRSAVIAASSGLVVTMGIPAANAAPVKDAGETVALPVLPEQAAPVLDDEVTVPANAAVSFAGTPVTKATPPPAPVVQPRPQQAAPERTTPQRASRSTARQAPSTTADSAAPTATGSSILSIAARYVGTPYRYGGTTPSGFDCSGYTQYVFKQVGVSLPRTSGAQRSATQRITRDQLAPGDLVFYGSPVSHVGMYIGGGQMVHSPHTGDVVKVSSIDRMGGGSMSFGRVG
jgi:cell wall-associated NlpC family hydrolase